MDEDIIRLRAERRAHTLQQIRSSNRSSRKGRSSEMKKARSSIIVESGPKEPSGFKAAWPGAPIELMDSKKPTIESQKRKSSSASKFREPEKRRSFLDTRVLSRSMSESMDEIPFDERKSTRKARKAKSETKALRRVDSSTYAITDRKIKDANKTRDRRGEAKYPQRLSVHSDDAFRGKVVTRMMEQVDASMSSKQFIVDTDSDHELDNILADTYSKPRAPDSAKSEIFRKPENNETEMPSIRRISSEENSLTITESLSEPTAEYTLAEETVTLDPRLRHYPSFVRALSVEMSEMGADIDTFFKEELPHAVEDMKSDFISTYCCCR